MVEADRFAVDDQTSVGPSFNVAMGQIPGGDVIGLVAHDVDSLEERRRQVHPPLIGEQPVGDVIVAVIQKTITPPAEKTQAFVIGANRQEADVVDAVLQTANFVVQNGAGLGFGHHLVGGQKNAVAVQHHAEGRQIGQDQNIRVKIDDLLRVVLLDNLKKGRPFHGGTQLHDRVLEDPGVQVRESQVFQADDRIEWFGRRIY